MSRLAWVFNLGMIVCGICIVIASLSLGILLPGFWAKAGLVLGVITGFALSMVGGLSPWIITRDMYRQRSPFFRAGFLMVIAFSLAFVLQKGDVLVASRWLGLAGLFPILAFGIFLGLMWTVRDVGYDVLSAPRSGETARLEICYLGVVNILRDDFLDPCDRFGNCLACPIIRKICASG